MPGPGIADYYASGQWNFVCDLCGKKQKSNRAMFTWNGLYVCKHHKEIRNPQDFLRGVKDDQSVPWSRPYNSITYDQPYSAQTCTLRRKNAVPGFAVPGCAMPGYVNLAFLPSSPNENSFPQCTLQGLNGVPGLAVPGCAIPRYNNTGLEPDVSGTQLDTIEGII